jgi:exodeoxyribonuclease V gamma subunit
VRALSPAGSQPTPAPVDVHVELPDGRRLRGTVSVAHGDLLLQSVYSRLGPAHRLRAWVALLAATASDPDRPFAAATIGRAPVGAGVSTAAVKPLGGEPGERREAALADLEALVDLYERGMREPLPIYCRTSAAYAEAAVPGLDAYAAAESAWTSKPGFEREDSEREHQLVLGGVVSFESLLAQAPRPGEHAPGWRTEETTRFGRLARRLWDGLLACEERQPE